MQLMQRLKADSILCVIILCNGFFIPPNAKDRTCLLRRCLLRWFDCYDLSLDNLALPHTFSLVSFYTSNKTRHKIQQCSMGQAVEIEILEAHKSKTNCMLIFDLKISIPFVNGVKLPTLRKILQYVTPGPMTKETHFLPEDPFNFILCKLSVFTNDCNSIFRDCCELCMIRTKALFDFYFSCY